MADMKKEPESLLRVRLEAKIAEYQFTLARIAQQKEEAKWQMEVLLENEKATKEALEQQKKQLESLTTVR